MNNNKIIKCKNYVLYNLVFFSINTTFNIFNHSIIIFVL